jgi:hypothetical protein
VNRRRAPRRACARTVVERAAGTILVLGLFHLPASAQIPRREPPPWLGLEIRAARSSIAFEAARFNDQRVGWSAQRFALTVLVPQGSASCLFVRLPWLTLETGWRTAATRWPAIVGVKAPEGWPAEARNAGWGSPEVGALGGLGFPALGRLQYALAAGLPVGRDVLYPFASTSLPVTLQLRKPWRVGDRWQAWLMAGRTWNFGSGRKVLSSEAFPGTFAATLGLAHDPAQRRGLQLSLGGEWEAGRRLLTAGAAWRVPVGAADLFTLSADRELLGRGERPYALRIAAAWVFTGLGGTKPEVAK